MTRKVWLATAIALALVGGNIVSYAEAGVLHNAVNIAKGTAKINGALVKKGINDGVQLGKTAVVTNEIIAKCVITHHPCPIKVP